MPRIRKKAISITTELFDALTRLAQLDGSSASYLASKAIQAFLKNPTPITLEIPPKTLAPRITDIVKNQDGSVSRRERGPDGYYWNTYRDGRLITQIKMEQAPLE